MTERTNNNVFLDTIEVHTPNQEAILVTLKFTDGTEKLVTFSKQECRDLAAVFSAAVDSENNPIK